MATPTDDPVTLHSSELTNVHALIIAAVLLGTAGAIFHGASDWGAMRFFFLEVLPLLLLAGAVYEYIFWRRFGNTTLVLARAPIPPGDTLRGRLYPRTSVHFREPLRVSLSLTDSQSRNHPSQRGVESIWDQQLVIAPNERNFRDGGFAFALTIPVNAPCGAPQFTWRLRVVAPMPDIDYIVSFEIPVSDKAPHVIDAPIDAAAAAAASHRDHNLHCANCGSPLRITLAGANTTRAFCESCKRALPIADSVQADVRDYFAELTAIERGEILSGAVADANAFAAAVFRCKWLGAPLTFLLIAWLAAGFFVYSFTVFVVPAAIACVVVAVCALLRMRAGHRPRAIDARCENCGAAVPMMVGHLAACPYCHSDLVPDERITSAASAVALGEIAANTARADQAGTTASDAVRRYQAVFSTCVTIVGVVIFGIVFTAITIFVLQDIGVVHLVPARVWARLSSAR